MGRISELMVLIFSVNILGAKKYFAAWMHFVNAWEKKLMDLFGVKDRTARGYAVVIAALRFIYEHNEETFLNLGHPWTEFEEVI